jgi:hypothetical protein
MIRLTRTAGSERLPVAISRGSNWSLGARWSVAADAPVNGGQCGWLLTGESRVRVFSNELFRFANYRATHGLTESAESSPSRRLSFSAGFLGVRDARRRRESSWPDARERGRSRSRPQLSPKLSRSLVNRPLWVNNPVRFGPRNERFTETTQLAPERRDVIGRREVRRPLGRSG